MKFNINHQLGKWQQVANGYVAGKAFFNNEMLEGEKLSRYFNHENPNDLAQHLKALSGQFAVVLDFEKWGFAAVDNVRSIPLFYSQTQQLITNYLDAKQCDLSDASIENGHFERIEYLFGKLTLASGYESLEPKSFLHWEGNESLIVSFQHHPSIGDNTDPESVLCNELTELLLNSLEQTIIMAGGRKILLPLSGGYDSRFIAAGLVKLGYKNVLAYTYGNPNNHEVKIASQVAEKLGLDWQLIEYNKSLFESMIDADFEAFMLMFRNLQSVPQEQDYFALKYLVENGLASNSVVVPGYCGDLHAGSFLPSMYFENDWKRNPISVADYVINHHIKPEKSQLSYWKNALFEIDEIAPAYENFISKYEEWVIQNRKAKYIVNTVRTAEYFGLDWASPLWNQPFSDFMFRLPLKYRHDKYLFAKVLEEQFFKPLEIDFGIGGFDKNLSHKSLLSMARQKLPKPLRKMAKKMVVALKGNKDVNDLHLAAEVIAKRIGHKYQGETVNQMMGIYLVHLLKHST